MKSLNIILSAFAILIFSGCYTQLLIEDDGPVASDSQPVASEPDPVIFVIPPPPRLYVSPYDQVSQTAYSYPGNTGQSADPQRTSGYQRGGSESSQDVSRNTGATRGSDQSRSTAQSSQGSTQVSVPSRESAATQTAIPQRGSQDNSTTGRRGGR
jgi:hypothetical protein